MATSQDFVNWVCSPDLTAEFLQYVLLAEGKDILRFASGSVHQTIYFPEVKAFHICYPPLHEQRRIVAILDEAFDRIAAAMTNVETNLHNARAVFDSHADEVFSQHGEGHSQRKLAEVYEFRNGINFDRTHKVDRGILTVDVLNMYGDDIRLRLDNLYRVNKEVSDDHILKDGDILVVRSSVKRDGVGWATLFHAASEPITFCGFIIRGRAIADVQGEYAVYFLRSSAARAELIRRATQSTITNINQVNLGELVLPLPSLPEQRQIVSRLHVLSESTRRLEGIYRRKFALLEELKQSLLHQAFSGGL